MNLLGTNGVLVAIICALVYLWYRDWQVERRLVKLVASDPPLICAYRLELKFTRQLCEELIGHELQEDDWTAGNLPRWMRGVGIVLQCWKTHLTWDVVIDDTRQSFSQFSIRSSRFPVTLWSAPIEAPGRAVAGESELAVVCEESPSFRVLHRTKREAFSSRDADQDRTLLEIPLDVHGSLERFKDEFMSEPEFSPVLTGQRDYRDTTGEKGVMWWMRVVECITWSHWTRQS